MRGKRDEREAGEELLLFVREGARRMLITTWLRVSGPRHAHVDDPVPVAPALADVDDGLRLPGSLRRLQPNDGSAPS
jgi:hypothetical protein